jgi:thiol:disulfide interchange protein
MNMKLFLIAALLLAPRYTPVTKYDPGRNADRDITEAIAEAQNTGKRILLEVGGDWCHWCHIMDDYFDKHPKLAASRDSNFITVKINFSPQNENEKVLSKYPKIPGYPHLFVLDTNGKLLHSQFTGELEQEESYNLQKFTDFLNKWAPDIRAPK